MATKSTKSTTSASTPRQVIGTSGGTQFFVGGTSGSTSKAAAPQTATTATARGAGVTSAPRTTVPTATSAAGTGSTLKYETGSLQGDLAKAAQLSSKGAVAAPIATIAPITTAPIAQPVATPVVSTPALQPTKLTTPNLSKIPAQTLSQAITGGDLGTVLQQNQDIMRQQIAAYAPTAAESKARQQLASATELQRGLVQEQLAKQAALKLQGAEVGTPIVGRQLAALQQEIATRQLPLQLQVSTLTDQLNIYSQERSNLANQLSVLANQGQFNANLALKFNEIAAAEKSEARKLAREYGINTPFYVEGGTVYRSSDGKPYANEQQFFSDPEIAGRGITSFNQAYTSGALSDLGMKISDRLSQQQQQFENQLKLQEFALNQDKFLWQQQMDKYEVVDFGGGVKGIVDKTTGTTVRNLTAQEKLATPFQLAQDQGKVGQITDLIQHNALNDVVGPTPITRMGIIAGFTGQAQTFIAGVEQLREQLTLDKLVQSKAQGATFGALSDGERQTLAAAASRLGTWAIKKKNPSTGELEVVGYNTSEKEFRKELDKINNYAKMDYIIKGGNPSDVGVTVQPDGIPVTRNSDGSVVQFTELVGRIPTAGGGTDKGFNPAGNALDSNVVKGMQTFKQKLPVLQYGDQVKPLPEAHPEGSYGGQCGVWVRSVVERQGMTYPRVGDTITQKAATVSKYGVPESKAKPGTVVITNENKNTGHVAYIIGQNPTGWILAESNYGLNGKVSYGRVLPYNSPSIIGYINPTKS